MRKHSKSSKMGKSIFQFFVNYAHFYGGKCFGHYFVLLRGMENFLRKMIGVTEFHLGPLSMSCGPKFAVNRKIVHFKPCEAGPGQPGRSEFF